VEFDIFLVSEADGAAIRTAFDQGSELPVG
jgi:hypothetical protein